MVINVESSVGSQPIGFVGAINGSAIARGEDGIERTLQVGDPVFANDVIVTGDVSSIVVDFIEFANDVVIDYEIRPTAATDIPAEYHEGLVSFNVLQFMPQMKRVVNREEAGDRQYTLNFHNQVWTQTINSINTTHLTTTEPMQMEDGIDWNQL